MVILGLVVEIPSRLGGGRAVRVFGAEAEAGGERALVGAEAEAGEEGEGGGEGQAQGEGD